MIVFRALSKEHIQQIVSLEIAKVAERLEEHEIVLRATPAALSQLADEGYDPEMGARPLRRIIQFKVEDRLSDMLLAGDFSDGDTILVDVGEDGEIILRREEKTPDEPEHAVEGA